MLCPILPFSNFLGQMRGRFGQGLGQTTVALRQVLKWPIYLQGSSIEEGLNEEDYSDKR